MKLNETTRTFPRQSTHYHPEQESVFGPYTDPNAGKTAEFWVYITLAFAAGFLVSHLWG